MSNRSSDLDFPPNEPLPPIAPTPPLALFNIRLLRERVWDRYRGAPSYSVAGPAVAPPAVALTDRD
jgi:hypothetical protein